MSEPDSELPRLLSELTRSLEALQSELDRSEPRLRPPTPSELAQFTSEVTIPAIILVLETNIRALRLLQRALRIGNGQAATGSGTGTQTRERAVKLGQATLSRLDDTLGDLQEALEGRPPDDDARELLQQIRDIEDDIEAELAASDDGDTTTDETDRVEIDVDAELQSLKNDLDENDSSDDTSSNS